MLNRMVIIQRPDDAQDGLGQPVVTWSTLATVWANVRHLSGIEAIKADAQTSLIRASIRIRRRTDVTPAMRVVLGTITYQINAVLPDEGAGDHVDLVCEVIT